jgi:hypothetical protein
MSYANGRITAPVSIADVQQALSNGSNDEGTLCRASNINMWARYKPQRADGPSPLEHGTNTDGVRTRKGGEFGLHIPFCTIDIMNGLVYNLVYQEGYEADGWQYLQPRGDRTPQGGVREFYRLSDFGRIQYDNTDPYYSNHLLSGYNHLAPLPFSALVETAGMTQHGSGQEKYYEINVQVINQLVFTFRNSAGYDLHLQDFINLTGQAIDWRPVAQVFNGYKPAGGTDWWLKSQADYQEAGAAITAAAGGSWTVVVDLNDSNFTPFVNVNEYFHLCLGVGCVNPSNWTWKDNNQSLFLLPYTQDQYTDYNLPFYFKFKLVSYQSRRIVATQLQFLQSQTTWIVVNPSASAFTINSNAGPLIRLTFTITKEPSQSLEFVGQYGTVQDQSNSPLKVQAREMIVGESGETIHYLSPTNSSWQTPSANPVVGVGQRTDTATLYATVTLNIANIPVNGGADYHLCAYTGATEGGQDKYDDIGYFRINKVQYQ